jgi:alpha-L-fucosidase
MAAAGRPLIRKEGTLDCDMVETTPAVFHGRLYRFESVRPDYWDNRLGVQHFRFLDVASGRATAVFGQGCDFGCPYTEGGEMHVYGVRPGGGSQMCVFRSRDLEAWSDAVAFELKGWDLFNNSVCRGDGRYVMAVEVGGPPEVVGVRFTMRFLESHDLLAWRLLPEECVFAKDRYTACPALRYLDGWYYMIYLEALPGWTFAPFIVRSRDLASWHSGPLNPVMSHSDEDKRIANPGLSAAQRALIAGAEDINNSDVDLCEFEGRTIIYYSWGSQRGVEFLAGAVYDGTLASFLRGFFPE